VNAAGGINGHKVQYVMADDASSPQGAAAAVNKMVRANIFGLLSVSSQFGAAAAVTRKAGLPVVGAAFDSSPAWSDPNYTNLFSASGTADPSVVATTFGTFFTSRGATKVAAAGGGSVSSAWVTAAAQKSAVHMGLKAGYLNTDVPTGSTDPAVVAKIVQGVRSSGSDALYLPLATNTAFAVIAGLRQAGVKMKSILVATGYGGELLKSPDAVKAAQGVDFVTLPAPVELGSQATRNFAGAVRKYGGSTDASSFGTYMGWVTADLFIHGMVATGPIVTRDGFIAALRVTSWSAGGLEGITDFSNPRPVGLGLGPENCMYVLKVQGKKFVPLPGAEPACGKVLLGVTTGFTFR
jgi:branched-chain amino acid transport system substrate-binding protein